MDKDERLASALMKVALGCKVKEVTEEYAEVDGALKLTKRREIKKDIPPDLKAVQMILTEQGVLDVEGMSDEELERERIRLLSELGESRGDGLAKKPARQTDKSKKRAKTTKKTMKSVHGTVKIAKMKENDDVL